MSELNQRQQAFADEYIITNDFFGVVYVIENNINDKKYVGITKRTVKQRFSEHCRADSYIGNSIRKYGKENFTVYIIDKANSEEELYKKEIDWIARFNSFEKGYNQTIGGDGVCGVVREKLNRKYTEKQLDFLNIVNNYNNKHKTVDINNPIEMKVFIVLNTVKLYLECEYVDELKIVSKTMAKLSTHYLKQIKNWGVVDFDELCLKDYQKTSSLGVV